MVATPGDAAKGTLIPDIAQAAKVPLVLMHMLGTPATMQDDPHYDDVVAEVEAFLAERCLAAEFALADPEARVIDPGIGFGKRDQDNYALLDGLARFTRLGHPVLVGTSRKAFIGRALDSPADERVELTLHRRFREIARVADRVIELSSGRIVSDGPPPGGKADIGDLQW